MTPETQTMDLACSLADTSPVTPALRERFLRGVVQAAAAQMAETCNGLSEVWLARCTEVLSANLASGRFGLSEPLDSDAPTLLAYVRQVLGVLLNEWERPGRWCGNGWNAWPITGWGRPDDKIGPLGKHVRSQPRRAVIYGSGCKATRFLSMSRLIGGQPGR